MQTSLLAIAKKAKDRKHYRFLNLYRLIDEKTSCSNAGARFAKNAAYGVDRVSAQEYGEHLIGNIRDLVERLKRKSYRARLVRRHYIPKPDGRMRPLGIPVVEDKLLQLAVTRILEAIYEQDFLRCSYGYRPNKGALDAVDKLTVKLQFGRYHFVVEADIKGFFDNIDHERLIELLSLRIADPSAAAADQEVAQGRSAGHGRQGDSPGQRNSARRDRFTLARQCVPALRA